jgi:hypothetical protein
VGRQERLHAIAILDEGYRAASDLLERLTERQIAARRTIGGGTWSAKDLLGHLMSWERNALDALEAWRRGERAPIDRALDAHGLAGVNEEAVAALARRSVARIRSDAAETHERLIRELRSIPDAEWGRPPTPRSRRSLGERLGALLGGPGGGFRHAAAHLPDLRAYVDSVARSSRRPASDSVISRRMNGR